MSDELSVAAIRQCSTCQVVSAIELDATPENVQKLIDSTRPGREVKLMRKALALRAWNERRGTCKCK